MSEYIIQVNDEEVKKQILDILNRIVQNELYNQYGGRSNITPTIETLVKEIVYSRKDEIVKMVVDRATREIVKKGLPKLLERTVNND